MSVRIQTAIYGIKESVFGITCLVPSDDIEEARYEITILTEERDALARTLATLAAAGITTGEDGAARWHGMTGAEIEGMVEALKAMGSCLSVDETRLGMLMINGTKTASEVPEQAARVERIKIAWAMRDAALAAAAGRGADGEAT